ncbi:unnamed protein product [Protopolystoma xenopodis]|uniref:Secreted protein n=1 Tax=Protopolystoma xenopodis TaxID=117903 RepID=A0A448XN26_9PLAT|nr:unnamed protein product [Protopolystoma xenopodis]
MATSILATTLFVGATLKSLLLMLTSSGTQAKPKPYRISCDACSRPLGHYKMTHTVWPPVPFGGKTHPNLVRSPLRSRL